MRFGRSGKKSVTDSQRAVAYRGPAGRKPDFSGSGEGLLTERTESTVVADCDGQLLLAGWVVLHWNTHTRVLWDITAGCAGGRRLFFAFHDSGSVHAQCYLGCHLSQPGVFLVRIHDRPDVGHPDGYRASVCRFGKRFDEYGICAGCYRLPIGVRVHNRPDEQLGAAVPGKYRAPAFGFDRGVLDEAGRKTLDRPIGRDTSSQRGGLVLASKARAMAEVSK